jgi:uncharacterized membrane protein
MHIRSSSRAALIAGLYTVLCLVLQPLSYGPVQVRISEALALLPVFTPDAIWGVTLGCLLSNAISMSPWDMLFGTLATLAAALLTRKLRHICIKGLPVLSCLPPIVINAVVVGLEITYLFMPQTASAQVLAFHILTVGAGQVLSCGVLGLALVRTIQRVPTLRALFEK